MTGADWETPPSGAPVVSPAQKDQAAGPGPRRRRYSAGPQGTTRSRRGSQVALALVALATVGLVATRLTAHAASKQTAASAAVRGNTARPQLHKPPAAAGGSSLPFPSPSGKGMAPGPNLAPGSDPSALPGDVLIADEDNSRLLVVNPAGNIVWQFPNASTHLPAGTTFLRPDDGFFAPNGRAILATEETDQVISLIDLRSQRILWRYGTPGLPGSGPNQLSNPDDAMLLPNNDVLIADIKNCSILLTRVGLHVPLQRFGIQDTYCYHAPPFRFGSPNGAFPLTDGNYLITEINGDWVDEMTLSGKILWSTHPPGVAYPSDTNEVSPGVFVTVDYSKPGQVVEFNAQGQLLWRYGPRSGPGMLDTPSLCEPIPTNGDFLCNDDGNDRVIVIDPRSNKIVWQYGHTGVEGTAPGYLSGPDGVDLAPPYSMLIRHRATIGLPSFTCSPGLPAGSCTVFRP